LNFKHLEELKPIGQRIDKTVDGFLLLVLYDMILDFSCQYLLKVYNISLNKKTKKQEKIRLMKNHVETFIQVYQLTTQRRPNLLQVYKTNQGTHDEFKLIMLLLEGWANPCALDQHGVNHLEILSEIECQPSSMWDLRDRWKSQGFIVCKSVLKTYDCFPNIFCVVYKNYTNLHYLQIPPPKKFAQNSSGQQQSPRVAHTSHVPSAIAPSSRKETSVVFVTSTPLALPT
jgi:hypothetical protein